MYAQDNNSLPVWSQNLSSVTNTFLHQFSSIFGGNCITEKQKHKEEYVEPTLNTGNRLKISIEEFSWEREGDGSTLGTEEPEQQEVVYITNLEDCLRKDGTALCNEKGPNEKSLLRETGLLKCPP